MFDLTGGGGVCLVFELTEGGVCLVFDQEEEECVLIRV